MLFNFSSIIIMSLLYIIIHYGPFNSELNNSLLNCQCEHSIVYTTGEGGKIALHCTALTIEANFCFIRLSIECFEWVAQRVSDIR